MSYKFNIFYVVVVIAALLSACSGEDGAVGPKGEQGFTGKSGSFQLGYFEGTATGTRHDGTPFSEPFSFEYANDSLNSFLETNGAKSIDFQRNGYYGSLQMRLKLTSDGNLVADSSRTYYFYFNHRQVLDSDSVFEINARPYFNQINAYTLLLSREKQEEYRFNTSNSTPYYYNSYHEPSGSNQYRFTTYIDDIFHDIYYDKSEGTLLGLYNRNSEKFVTEGEVFDHYNELKFMYNDDLGFPVFYDAESGEALYEEIPDVAADEITIENYKRDETTGVISFDYEIKISQYGVSPRENSTYHDLAISGSFNSGNRIYTNTINRIGG